MNIAEKLQKEFAIKAFQVTNTIQLIDEGNTIPFIARYRKEMTGSLDDQVLRNLSERLQYLRNMEEKREQIKKSIEEQGKLTEDLELSLQTAGTMTELEDIYRPYRPKRRTRASIARESGLEPLAELIWGQRLLQPLADHAKLFIDEDKGIKSTEEALRGAKDILAERISDDADIRKWIRLQTKKKGKMISKGTKEQPSVYELYYDYSEPLKTIAPHRILAINRGEKEGFLSVKIEFEEEEIFQYLSRGIIKKDSQTREELLEVFVDSLKRLIYPAIEREIRNDLTQMAEEKAITVFSENLRQLLLQPPLKDKVVLALDPAYRTGCKIAVIDQTGKTLATTVVYPTPPQKKIEEAKVKLKQLIETYNVELIAIGNGTASRESELFVVDLLKEIRRKVSYVIVNEAGASVYSASKLGAEEFPEFDVALRSAVSIGRRLQDPLAELVKIDPESIGVGQYQHDMNQKRLREALSGVVEDCVNKVGVDLNTASPSLLSYVSGISGTVSKNIVKFREEHGKFMSRKELLKVPKLGNKAFEQCAGFLRIPESPNPFDHTGVHPESYAAAEGLLKLLHIPINELQGQWNGKIRSQIVSLEQTAKELGIGVPTLKDMVDELEKPGRDPRDQMPLPILRQDVLAMEDLKEGMILMGTVRNVIDFGVFVDIGVHQDGLVHISQITDRFIKHPLDAVKVGDVVKVKVLGIDLEKKRISLTMRI